MEELGWVLLRERASKRLVKRARIPKRRGRATDEEIGVDAAIKAGGKYSFKPAWLPTSGNASKNGLGIGVGPNLGYGLAAGYDWGRKRSWCINAPDEQNCNER